MILVKNLWNKIIRYHNTLFLFDPEFPNPRVYWTCEGYEPFSWSFSDIELAKKAGWTEIIIHEKDEYPYLKGVISGLDPRHHFSFYLPKYSQWSG
jgi:hypothetical protein